MVSRMLKEVVLLACIHFSSHPISLLLARRFLGMEISKRRSDPQRFGRIGTEQLRAMTKKASWA